MPLEEAKIWLGFTSEGGGREGTEVRNKNYTSLASMYFCEAPIKQALIKQPELSVQ
jgi:hypothetical protein